MTDKIFSMPVRVNDFIANTVHLSNENMGIYWRLLCFSWENKAKLTSNLEEIYEICKAYDEKTKKKVDGNPNPPPEGILIPRTFTNLTEEEKNLIQSMSLYLGIFTAKDKKHKKTL